MRLLPATDSLSRWLVLPFLLAGSVALLVAHRWPELILRVAHCPWRAMTGLACPSCGGTHALVALAAGHWQEAWTANPAVPLGVLALAAWTIWAALAGLVPTLRVRLVLSRKESRAARAGTALLIVLLWLRQIVSL